MNFPTLDKIEEEIYTLRKGVELLEMLFYHSDFDLRNLLMSKDINLLTRIDDYFGYDDSE